MNLIMPLADTTAVGKAKAVQMVAANIDELFTGLNNIGTVHSARFDLIGDYLCIITVYDGDHEVYIRDFISVFGSVFDAMIKVVADPPPWPVRAALGGVRQMGRRPRGLPGALRPDRAVPRREEPREPLA